MMSQKLLQFINSRILRDHKIIKEDLWVRNGIIINPEKIFFDEKIIADVKIDCHNSIIAPGFIDLQINGAFGIDFTNIGENTEEKVNEISKGLLKYGVTSFCPTMVTSPKEVYHKIVPKIERKPGGKHGATILGLHLEGPFINVNKKGAHPQECIKSFDKGMATLLDIYGNLDNVAIVTLAPELMNAKEVIKQLTAKNIIASIGHSMANMVDGEEAVKHGANLITHLFNAMLPFHHRNPGLLGLLTSENIVENKIVYFGIIADGVHTHSAALKIAYRTHPNGLILVTDAISALGLQEGKHNIGQFQIEIREGKAFVAGTDTLCGSIASMNECIQFFKKATGCSKEYALEAASLHPALLMKIANKKGSLNFGCDADFVLLDDHLNLISTWIAGECVYERENTILSF